MRCADSPSPVSVTRTPRVSEAIAEQARTLIHTSNLYGIAGQQKLADRLTALSGMDNVFFGNSGAEANEAAIKIARLYGHERGIDFPHTVVMDNSFHGRTMATLTATGNRKVHAGFEPLLGGFVRAPFNDIDAVSRIADNDESVVAVMVEPILGEGGIHIPEDDYLTRLRALCDANDWLLILDEVQTGNGRSGKYFCYQHSDILPDVVTTAKGLGKRRPHRRLSRARNRVGDAHRRHAWLHVWRQPAGLRRGECGSRRA